MVQVYQSAAYSSSMNHLFCDRLSVIVQSEQFGRSQWETRNRRGLICYCLINAINISCNTWTLFPKIFCCTFSLSGQMGKQQHLGFDGNRVTNGSEACVRTPDCIPALRKLWKSLLLTKDMTNTERQKYRHFKSHSLERESEALMWKIEGKTLQRKVDQKRHGKWCG